ncbi:MAG: hypothetical protein U0X20_17080 [Caldilineaceae bacterium]
MSATPLGPFAYVTVFLMLLSFGLGLAAGILMRPPQLHLKDTAALPGSRAAFYFP